MCESFSISINNFEKNIFVLSQIIYAASKVLKHQVNSSTAYLLLTKFSVFTFVIFYVYMSS